MSEKKHDPIGASLEVADGFLIQAKDVKDQIPAIVRKENTDKPTEQDVMDDFNFARETITDLIKKGMTVLNGSIAVANESQHPRAFEVTSNIMRQVSDLSKDLLELQQTLKKIEADGDKTTPYSEGGDVHNHIHVGTTDNLGKVLSEMEDRKK